MHYLNPTPLQAIYERWMSKDGNQFLSSLKTSLESGQPLPQVRSLEEKHRPVQAT